MKKRFVSILLSLILVLCMISPCFAKSPELVALTFDDGPGPYTEELLNGLAKRGVRATFFIVGKNVSEKYQPLIKRAYQDGHQIASHTYSHVQLTKTSDAEIRNQLSRTSDILGNAIGRYDLQYVLRPPYGAYSDHTRAVIGVPQFYWSVDPADWKYRDSNTVYKNIISHADDGHVILLHDIHKTSVDAALKVVDTLQSWGYEFVTLNEMARRKGTVLEAGTVYRRFSGQTIDDSRLTLTGSPRLQSLGYEISFDTAEGAVVYYTLDGSDPAIYGIPADGEVLVQKGNTLRAVAAYNLNGDRSKEYKFAFTGGAAVNREYAVEKLYQLAGSPQPQEKHEFTDTSSSADSWAIENGITTGYGDGSFRPFNTLSRQQFAAMYYRYANACGLDTSILADISYFNDYKNLASYAEEPFAYMVGIDIIHGKAGNILAPTDPLTYNQMDIIFNNLKALVD